MVNAANQLRLRQVQLVIAPVDKNAFGVEKRPHGSVAKHGRLFQPFLKVSSHLLENTGRDAGVSNAAVGVRLGPRSECRPPALL